MIPTHFRAALRRTLVAIAATASLVFPWTAQAQDAWPDHAVQIVVPFSPGGTTDVLARIIGHGLSVLWGQPVLIENRAGAGGNVGASVVVRAASNGYTLLLASGSITINPSIYKRMPFDTKKDLMPITNVASAAMLVVVPDGSPVKTIKDLIALAKAEPGAINFGSAGIGSQVHMAGEHFADAADIDITHVPYNGEAPAYTDLIANRVQMMVGNFTAASALLGKGSLRALAVTGKQRSPQLPDVPAVAESGLPGFENTGWFGLFAPAGTPPAVVAKVQRDVAKMLGETEIKAQLYQLGMTPVGNTPGDFERELNAEFQRWEKVVKDRKITAQ